MTLRSWFAGCQNLRVIITPLTGVFAAEVRGLDVRDVARDVDDRRLDALRAAACQHEVLVIRDQNLGPAEQSAFSRRLGPSAETPFVATMSDFPDVIRVVKEADEGAAFNFGGAWHSDFSFLEFPPSFTILAAVDVPPWGGDTVFASMTSAWAALSGDTQARIRQLDGIHTARDAYSRRMQPLHSGMRGMNIVCDDTADEVRRHPLVTRHPETGREVLFFNRAYVRDLVSSVRDDGSEEELSSDEAAELLRWLHEHTTDVRFTYRHRWVAGDVVMWDNRSVQHNALNDYAGFRREMRRTTVVGQRPAR